MTDKTPPVAVTVVPGMRLAQLLAQYDEAEAAAKEAAERFEAIKTAVKAEMSSVDPKAQRFIVNASTLKAPLKLLYVESWRIDADRLKKEDPNTYVKWAKKGGRWELRRATS